MRKHPDDDGREVYFEIRRRSGQAFVTAIDSKTAVEATYVGSSLSPKKILTNNARYALFKKQEQERPTPPTDGTDIIV